jgi:hypothetical protein
MSDGSGRHAQRITRVGTEKLLAQRNCARRERDELHHVIDVLVHLKDGPRREDYDVAQRAAWHAARESLRGVTNGRGRANDDFNRRERHLVRPEQ